MVFPNTQMPGMNFAFPDVCLTPIPTPAGPVPVPIPYPNFSNQPTFVPSQFTTLMTCMPTHNLLTMGTISYGDNVGVYMNPLSGMVMGPTRHLIGSFTLLIGGMPTSKMLMPAGQNGISPGALGMTIVPSQFTTISLS